MLPHRLLLLCLAGFAACAERDEPAPDAAGHAAARRPALRTALRDGAPPRAGSKKARRILREQTAAGAEHAFVPAAGGELVAASPHRGFRAALDERGALRVERGGSRLAPAFVATLRMARVGSRAVPPARARAHAGNRVELPRDLDPARPGDELLEWWLNGPHGLEHGATLLASAGPELVLDVAVEGGLAARLAAGGGVAVLATPDGRHALRYGRLHAEDASGSELPASLDVVDGAVRIRVALAGAVFPVLVDPLLWADPTEVSGTGTDPDDAFAAACRLGGTLGIVGAKDHGSPAAGAAFVYERDTSGWSEEGMLKASDGAAGDYFGWGVAVTDGHPLLPGNPPIALVGAPHRASFDGGAYVFQRSGTTWSEVHQVTASSPGNAGGIGYSVAIAENGDLLIGEPDANQVLVQRWVDPSWVPQNPIQAAAPATTLGKALATGGPLVVAGAPAESTQGVNAGAAYVYRLTGSVWAPEGGPIHAPDAAEGDRFGEAVAVDYVAGNYERIVVGAPKRIGAGGEIDVGTAYVFTFSAGQWMLEDQVSAKAPAQWEAFGSSVALWEDIAFVGSFGSFDAFGLSGSDWAHVFRTATPPGSSTYFGKSLAVDASTLLVCAPFNGSEQGSAIFYARECDTATEGSACKDWDPCRLVGTCVSGGCEALPVPDGTGCPGGACQGGTCVLDDAGAAGAAGQAGQAGGAGSGGGGQAGAGGQAGGGQAGAPAPDGGAPPPVGDFQSCASDDECASGYCVDNVCCDSRCDGACRSCALPASPGVCSEVPTGTDPDNDCGGLLSCTGTCGPGGECVAPFAGMQCLPARCIDTARGVGAAFCAGAGADCSTEDAVPFDCAPYACSAAFGSCFESCRNTQDCAPGHVCTDRACAAPDAESAEDEGCGCRAAGSRTAAGWLVLLLGAAAMLRSRRRR